MTGQCIAYYRVSTQQQGQSGLGLDAQREAVARYATSTNRSILKEFTEVESGRKNTRPQLEIALQESKKKKATLVIAKLDRLSRNLYFIAKLIESKVDFVAVDLPQANKTTIQLMAVLAEMEADLISQRTKAALAEAKRRGKRLGNPNLKADNKKRIDAANEFALRIKPTIDLYLEKGMSQRKMVTELNRLRVPAAKGGQWSLSQLQRVIKRVE